MKCGVIISKFRDISKRPDFDRKIQLEEPPESKLEKSSSKLVKWAVGLVIFLIVLFLSAFFYFGHRLTNMHELHSSSQWYCDSFGRALHDVCIEEKTCCYECLITVLESDQYTNDEIEDLFQKLIPPDEIRELGFLIARDLTISDNAKNPILISKTPIEPVRPKYGGPPGKDHMVVYAGYASTWMTPSDYKALDQTQHIDIEILIKRYNELVGE